MAAYPGAIYAVPSFGTNLSDPKVHSTWRDEMVDEVRAIELELGTHPSGPYSTVKERLDAATKRFSVSGAGAVGFSAEGQIAVLTAPPQPAAGFLLVWGLCYMTKTVAADQFFVRLRDTNLTGALLAISQMTGTTQWTGHPSCSLATVAGVAKTVVMTVGRGAGGTGSGTVFADASANRLDALWIPSV